MNCTKTCIAISLFLITSCLSAQTAPLPSQLAAAKTVFISNAFVDQPSEGTSLYNQAYTAVQALNRFTIVASPQQADLVLEFGFSTTSLTLRILDPKFPVILWSVSEGVQPAARSATQQKNLQTAVDHLATDLQVICMPAPSPTN